MFKTLNRSWRKGYMAPINGGSNPYLFIFPLRFIAWELGKSKRLSHGWKMIRTWLNNNKGIAI